MNSAIAGCANCSSGVSCRRIEQRGIGSLSDQHALVAEVRRLRARTLPVGSTWVDAEGRSWLVGHPATCMIDPKTGETQWLAQEPEPIIRHQETNQ